jgi:hypothetical protein
MAASEDLKTFVLYGLYGLLVNMYMTAWNMEYHGMFFKKSHVLCKDYRRTNASLLGGLWRE